ncbi:L-threonine 3-dehydrogenase [bacterium HR16]|nr:L-threonine 3-dehydrogenase [bacterium HR16]
MNEYAITFTARERAELLPIERDTSPLQPDEVAGRTIASLISTGTELNAGFLADSFPRRTGYAAVFRVEEVGTQVSGFRRGDIAYCMGPHQSFQRVSESSAILVPQGLSPYEAVFARLMGVSMSTLTTTTARPPQRVLVTGLGIVGHLAARIFQICGYEVIGCDPSEKRREIARNAGIAAVYPHVPVEELAGTVALVLECSGNEEAALYGCKVVCKRGEVVLVGTPWRRYTDHTAFELTHAIFHHYAVVRSGWEWELPLHPQDFRTNSIFGNQEAAMRWLAEGKISVKELYTPASPMECQKVYQSLLHGDWDTLTAVFDWGQVS